MSKEILVKSGLLVFVYRSQQDCSLNGITNRCTQFVLLVDGKTGPFIPNSRSPGLVLNEREIHGNKYQYATIEGEERRGQFGGNFIYTSDSRFPSRQPIPVHDRFEG